MVLGKSREATVMYEDRERSDKTIQEPIVNRQAVSVVKDARQKD